MAACVLHNFCLINNDFFEENYEPERFPIIIEQLDDGQSIDRRLGAEKRNNILNTFFN